MIIKLLEKYIIKYVNIHGTAQLVHIEIHVHDVLLLVAIAIVLFHIYSEHP